MMLLMVKEADLNWTEVPEDYEILDATALAGDWGSSGTLCLRTSPEGTSDAYPAPTASLLWDLSGTRRASKDGKQGRIGRVASRRGNGESRRRRGD